MEWTLTSDVLADGRTRWVWTANVSPAVFVACWPDALLPPALHGFRRTKLDCQPTGPTGELVQLTIVDEQPER